MGEGANEWFCTAGVVWCVVGVAWQFPSFLPNLRPAPHPRACIHAQCCPRSYMCAATHSHSHSTHSVTHTHTHTTVQSACPTPCRTHSPHWACPCPRAFACTSMSPWARSRSTPRCGHAGCARPRPVVERSLQHKWAQFQGAPHDAAMHRASVSKDARLRRASLSTHLWESDGRGPKNPNPHPNPNLNPKPQP